MLLWGQGVQRVDVLAGDGNCCCAIKLFSDQGVTLTDPQVMTKLSRGRRAHGDVDPEDLDSNYAPSSLLTLKRGSDMDKRSREHLGDVRKLKRGAVYDEDIDDDDIDRFGEKYRGERRSRRELGLERSEASESEESGSMSGVESNASIDDNGDSDDIEAELREMEEEDVLDAPKMFATSRTTPAESGRALRAHFKAYSRAMETRSRMQPLLGAANRLGSQNRMGLGERREIGMRHVLIDMISRDVDDMDVLGGDPSMKRIWHVMEQQHSKLMQEAQAVLDSEYVVPVGKSRAKKMKVINQSIWSQVQLAMQDKDRLLERVGRRRIPGSECIIGERGWAWLVHL